MPDSRLGLCATSYLSIWQSIDTLEFLERCHRFGAAGAQAVIHGDPQKIRSRVEQYEMYFEAMVPLPRDGDSAELENSLKAAAQAGATALRAACLGTRRYETFPSLAAWQQHVADSRRSLQLALPLLDRYRIPLGLENHKDWTADELVALMREYSSEYFGVCLDFGNNVAFIEEPMATIAKLAPYAVSTHVKDVAFTADAEGILMNEVVLGSGMVKLAEALRLLRYYQPRTRFTLEMITREPLRVPVFTDEYRATLPALKPEDWDHFLRSADSQVQRLLQNAGDEDHNIAACFAAWPNLIGQI